MLLRASQSVWPALMMAAVACGPGASSLPETTPPARVSNATPESELTTVTLSPEARARLGIEIALVERRRMQRFRTLGGEAQAPPGGAITVTAPQSGTILPPSDGAFPIAGVRVRRGQLLFRLLALPGGDPVRAREEALVAETRVNLARTKARRATELFQERAASARSVQEAEAELRSAEATLEVARARVALLSGAVSESELEALAPLHGTSPLDGIVQRVHAAPQQTVAAGAPLFEIVKVDPLWVRVPVYSGELSTIDKSEAATIEGRAGRPVTSPPTADLESASVDIYYQISNSDGSLVPGQRVSVSLPLREADESLVLPWSAVIHDVSGGTWVYEETAPNVFVRRRVEIAHVSADLASVARGPSEGSRVVSVGAAEIFGTEFGTGK